MPRKNVADGTDSTTEVAAPRKRATKAKSIAAEPATPREVREFLLAAKKDGTLPEGVKVGVRGRLSTAARDHFTSSTRRSIIEQQVVTE